MGGKSLPALLAGIFFLAFLASGTQAYSFYATTNKLVYTPSDTLTVTGNITSYLNELNITALVSNSTPVSFYNMSSNSTGSNIFSLSQSLSGLSSGVYSLDVSDGSGAISLGFEIVSAITYLEAHLIDVQDIVPVNTSI